MRALISGLLVTIGIAGLALPAPASPQEASRTNGEIGQSGGPGLRGGDVVGWCRRVLPGRADQCDRVIVELPPLGMSISGNPATTSGDPATTGCAHSQRGDCPVSDVFLRNLIEHLAAAEPRLKDAAVRIARMTIEVSGAFGRTSFAGPVLLDGVRLVGSPQMPSDTVPMARAYAQIRLEDLAFRSAFEIRNSTIEDDVEIADVSFGGDFLVVHSVFRRGISLRNIRAEGSLELMSTSVEGCIGVRQAQVQGSVVLSSSTVSGGAPPSPGGEAHGSCVVTGAAQSYAVSMDDVHAEGNVQIADSSLGGADGKGQGLYMARVAADGSLSVRGNDLRGRAIVRQARAAVLEVEGNTVRDVLGVSGNEAHDIGISRNEVLSAVADPPSTAVSGQGSPTLEARDNKASGSLSVEDNDIRRRGWWIDVSSNEVGGELVWYPGELAEDPSGAGRIVMTSNKVEGSLWAYFARKEAGAEASCVDPIPQWLFLSGSHATTVSLELIGKVRVCAGEPDAQDARRTPIRLPYCGDSGDLPLVFVDMTSMRAGTLEWNLPVSNCLYRYDGAAMTFQYWGMPALKQPSAAGRSGEVAASSGDSTEDRFIDRLQRWRQQMLPRNTETLMMLGDYLGSRGRLAESLEMKREAKQFHYMEEKDDQCRLDWSMTRRVVVNMATLGRANDTDDVIACRESAKRKAIGSLLWFSGFGVKPANVVGWLGLVWLMGTLAYWITANTRLEEWNHLSRAAPAHASWAFRAMRWVLSLPLTVLATPYHALRSPAAPVPAAMVPEHGMAEAGAGHWQAARPRPLRAIGRWLAIKLLESRDIKETPSGRPWFMQFDEDGRPQHFSLAIYSLDAMLPVLTLHHYDKYFPRYRVIRWVRVGQRVAGWILLSVLVASAAVL